MMRKHEQLAMHQSHAYLYLLLLLQLSHHIDEHSISRGDLAALTVELGLHRPCLILVRERPHQCVYFANEVHDGRRTSISWNVQ